MANPPIASQMAIFFQSRASEMSLYQGIHSLEVIFNTEFKNNEKNKALLINLHPQYK